MSDLHAPAAVRLTPSETVLLHGDRFAGEAGMLGNKEELLTVDKKVSADQLAEAALAAAVLGAEQAGSLRLEARTKKALFGLVSRRALYAERAGGAGWPEGTLEAQLAARLGAEPAEVGDLVYAMLERDTHSPADDVLDRAKRGLFARGMLEREEVKKLKIFTSYRYRPAPGLADALRENPADGARALLDRCERERAEVWQLLRKQVAGALSRRREQDFEHD
ncbi:MAG TPA: hypothetical protein VHG51_12570 [Longimicrobiaceae bacterium]|nr:hypothetical protein [Longimicrobiaceae bacterium]